MEAPQSYAGYLVCRQIHSVEGCRKVAVTLIHIPRLVLGRWAAVQAHEMKNNGLGPWMEVGGLVGIVGSETGLQ